MKIIEKYKLIAPFPAHTIGEFVIKRNATWFFESKDVEVPSYLLADETFFEPVYKEITGDYYYLIENEIVILYGNSYYKCINENKRKNQFNLDVVPHASFLISEVIRHYYYIKIDEVAEIKDANSLVAGYNLLLYFKRKKVGNCFASEEEAKKILEKVYNLLKKENENYIRN